MSDVIDTHSDTPDSRGSRRITGISSQTTFTLSALVIVIAAVVRVETGFSTLREAQVTAQVTALAPVLRSQNDMQQSLGLIDYRLRIIESTGAGGVSASVFRAWVADFKERNPTLSVPAVQ